MRVLIDGDGLVYTCGFAGEKRTYVVTHLTGATMNFNKKSEAQAYCALNGIPITSPYLMVHVEHEPLSHTLHTVKLVIQDIITNANRGLYVSQTNIYLSGKTNYRTILAPDYKKNRDPNFKPYWYDEIRQYMIDVWKAEVVEGMEADDKLSIEMNNRICTSVLVSADKDLNMVGGYHYNPRKKVNYYVFAVDAITWFYCQLLLGDTVDNIKGIKGYGPWRTYKAFEDVYMTYNNMPSLEIEEYERELYKIVLGIYNKTYGEDEGKEKLFINAQLLWMLQDEGKFWAPPEIDV